MVCLLYRYYRSHSRRNLDYQHHSRSIYHWPFGHPTPTKATCSKLQHTPKTFLNGEQYFGRCTARGGPRDHERCVRITWHKRVVYCNFSKPHHLHRTLTFKLGLDLHGTATGEPCSKARPPLRGTTTTPRLGLDLHGKAAAQPKIGLDSKRAGVRLGPGGSILMWFFSMRRPLRRPRRVASAGGTVLL